MTTHVSPLVLDELVAGSPVPQEAKAHVESCVRCTARVASLRAARVESAASFAYARTRARLAAAPAPSRWRVWAFLLVPAFVALLAFVVLGQRAPVDDRLKGAASLEIVDAAGVPVTQARVGAHVRLRVGTAGFTHALAVATDADGSVAQLWPEGTAADVLPGTGVVTLPRDLEVTPGPVTVEVLLSNATIAAPHTLAELPAARRSAGASASARLEVLP